LFIKSVALRVGRPCRKTTTTGDVIDFHITEWRPAERQSISWPNVFSYRHHEKHPSNRSS